MPVGTVKSYSAQKKYGFIESETGESVFFHASDVSADSVSGVRAGCIVSFDEVPKPKGMAAGNVVLQGVAAELYSNPDASGIIVSKSESCGKKNRVVHKLPRVVVEDRDPNAAMELLKRKADEIGCNAIVNLARERRTGEAWTSNYKYTVHVMSAELALVKAVLYTSDMKKSEKSRRELEQEISRLAGKEVENVSVTDAGGFKLIFRILTGIVVAIVFATIFSSWL